MAVVRGGRGFVTRRLAVGCLQDARDAVPDEGPGQQGAPGPPLLGDRLPGCVPALVNVMDNVGGRIEPGQHLKRFPLRDEPPLLQGCDTGRSNSSPMAHVT